MAALLAMLAERIRGIGDTPVVFTDEEIDGLESVEIDALIESFGRSTLMALPGRETRFFAWLKERDRAVWDEVMGGQENTGISLAFLPRMREGGNGLPICDLETLPNYFFTSRHIKPEGLAAIPAILANITGGREIAVGEALMVEILKAPIDLWHFCHRHDVPLAAAKRAVEDLVAHDWIVHLTSIEDLSPYIQDMFQPSQQRGNE